jgi:hypothetical protein
MFHLLLLELQIDGLVMLCLFIYPYRSSRVESKVFSQLFQIVLIAAPYQLALNLPVLL